MSDDTSYNGWSGYGNRSSAYATWRVNLEIIDDLAQDIRETFDERPDEEQLADYFAYTVDEIIFGGVPEGLAIDYARAFLDDVNWREIAANVLYDFWPEEDESEDDDDESEEE